MTEHTHEHRNHGFVIAVAAGAVVGAGLALWLGPRPASESPRRMTDSPWRFGQRVSERDQQTNTDEAADDLTQQGQDARDQVASIAVRGPLEPER